MAEKNEETPENADTADATAGEGADAADAVSVEAAGATADERADAGDAASAEAAPAEEAPAAEAKPKAAPKSGPTRREQLEAKRAERRGAAGRRKSRTPEERAAERAERRAALAKQRRAYRQRLKAKKAERRAAEPPREPDHALEHPASLRSSSASPGGRPKVREGIVVSEKGDKTITVAIDMVRRHKRYHKIMRSTVKLYAHDERNDAHEGDTVRVQECRPMSRSKRWRLVDVVERAR